MLPTSSQSEKLKSQFQGLSIHMKLLIIIASFLIPLSVTITILINSQMSNVSVAKLETKGNEYQLGLENVFQHIIEHKIYTLEKKDYNSFEKIESDIKKSLADLKQIDSNIGEDLQFNEESLIKRNRQGFNYLSLERKINDEIFANIGKKQYPSLDSYNSVITHIQTMITHAGDMSQLILDPVLDSYYLMDVTLLALPELQYKLQDFASFLSKIGPDKQLTSDEITKLNVYIYSIKDITLARISASVTTSIQENNNSYGVSESLKPSLQSGLENLTKSVDNMLVKLTNVNTFSPSLLSEINLSLLNSITQTFDYQKTAFKELNKIFDIRISYYSYNIIKGFIFVILAILLSFAISFFLGRSIIIPLRKVYNDLKQSSQVLSNQSHQIKDLSNSVALASNEQDSLVNTTAASISEITSMVGRTTQLTDESTGLVKDIEDKTDSSKVSIDNMVISMDQIYQSSLQLKEIEKIIAEIEKKTQVINNIVSKTELLSLNASIEAARAGEYGKGFAVVAEEVGNLASVSGKSSNEIRELLAQSRKQIYDILNQTIGKIEEGQGKTKEVSTSFLEIEKRIEQISYKIVQVTDAAKEQEIGIRQISQAITDIEKLSRTNTSVSKNSMDVAEQIDKSGKEMEKLAKNTKNIIYGTNRVQKN